jgi:hypothetical protein
VSAIGVKQLRAAVAVAVVAVAACDRPAPGASPSAVTAPLPPASAVPAAPAPPAEPPAAAVARPGAAATQRAGFDQTLERQGILFRVSSANAGSLNRLRIEPKGLTGDNAVIEQKIEGTVTMAEVAKLAADGSPEVYVYVTTAGRGSYGSLVA